MKQLKKQNNAPQVEVEIDEEMIDGEVSTNILENAVNLITKRFNLNGENYTVTAFQDKGSEVIVEVANAEFILKTTIRQPVELNIR